MIQINGLHILSAQKGTLVSYPAKLFGNCTCGGGHAGRCSRLGQGLPALKQQDQQEVYEPHGVEDAPLVALEGALDGLGKIGPQQLVGDGLGSPAERRQEGNGGGGPWRDILEEMAGNLSGEFGVATSDVFDGSGDKRNDLDDGVSDHGSIRSDNLQNLIDGPKSFEMKPKGKRRDFELEAALQNLTSDEVEQRRARMFGEESLTYHGRRLERVDSITSNGFDSPGK